ncbi:hypothetical protein [Mesorhizobium huakuii]|nr:hypothetical protein [Mesorhizobium huakuii]
MRFSLLLLGWVAFCCWDFATNDGRFITGLGTQVAKLINYF